MFLILHSQKYNLSYLNWGNNFLSNLTYRTSLFDLPNLVMPLFFGPSSFSGTLSITQLP